MLETLKRIVRAMRPANRSEAFVAGEDCGRHGATDANCHFRFFGSPELTRAWEDGKLMGEVKRRLDQKAASRRARR